MHDQVGNSVKSGIGAGDHGQGQAMTIRTILAPVRGDGKGEAVLDHAVAVAGRFGAHVLVVHARPNPGDMLPFGIPVTGAMKQAILDAAAANAAREEARVRICSTIFVGPGAFPSSTRGRRRRDRCRYRGTRRRDGRPKSLPRGAGSRI